MATKPRIILNKRHLALIIERLCYQLIENHNDFSETVLIGLQPRGVALLNRMVNKLNEINPGLNIVHGSLDITFYRDDFRRRAHSLEAKDTEIDFVIEGKHVILIDDVLYTARSVRSGLDALMDFGRPATVELLVLIERRFSRHLPIKPDYVGTTVDAVASERVEVCLHSEESNDDSILLYRLKSSGREA